MGPCHAHCDGALQQLDDKGFIVAPTLKNCSWRGATRAPTHHVQPNHGQDDAGYDSEEEERDLHHQDMYMNGGRNHHFGPPPTQEG